MDVLPRFLRKNVTALSNLLFNKSKNGRDFEDLFPTYTLSAPVTFLTGNHVYKSDLTKSRLRLHQQEIWVLDKVKINVVVQFYPCFFICFNLGMVMYDNEFETKENKI